MVLQKILIVHIPFLFYGSTSLSLFAIADEIKGWGNQNVNYYFQMWRDIPSHVIDFRNKLGVESIFLTNLRETPINPVGSTEFRYDYLANGEIPAGFWLKFSMGIDTQAHEGYLRNIHYSLYNSEINNTEVHKLNQDRIDFSAIDFLILLTNVSVSSADGANLFDPKDKNVQVYDDDTKRREFNIAFFETYLDYLVGIIEKDKSNIMKIIGLSGITIIVQVVKRNEKILKELIQLLSTNNIPIHVKYAIEIEMRRQGLNPNDSSLELDFIQLQEELSPLKLFNW